MRRQYRLLSTIIDNDDDGFISPPSRSPEHNDFLHPEPPFANDAADMNLNETWCKLGIRDTQSEINSGHISLDEIIDFHRLRAETIKTCYGYFHDIYSPIRVKDFSGKCTLQGHGIVATIKDSNINYVAKSNHQGSMLNTGVTARYSHVAVKRLEEKGVAILAQTSCSELGLTPSGNNNIVQWVRNPFNPYLTTGGSSSGSAGSVAAKVGHFSLGNDRAGSLRIPASFCGCVAIRPQRTLDIQHSNGTYPFGNNLTSLGPIARCVQDAAIALDLLASWDSEPHKLEAECAQGASIAAGAPILPKKTLRIASLASTKWYTPDIIVGNAFAKAVRRIKSMPQTGGISVYELDPNIDEPMYPNENPAPHIRDYWARSAFEMMTNSLRKNFPEFNTNCLSSDVQTIMNVGKNVTTQRLNAAIEKLQSTTLATFFDEKGFDALITPTVGVLPWNVELLTPRSQPNTNDFTTDWNAFTYPVNFANLASGTLNCGWHQVSERGREYVVPIGLQVIVSNSGTPYENVCRLIYLMGCLERVFAHVHTEHGFPRFSPLVF